MVEWSKTWDLSLYELPHHASGAGSNPAPVIVLFPPTHAHGVPKKILRYLCKYIESRCEKGSETSKYRIKQGSRRIYTDCNVSC